MSTFATKFGSLQKIKSKTASLLVACRTCRIKLRSSIVSIKASCIGGKQKLIQALEDKLKSLITSLYELFTFFVFLKRSLRYSFLVCELFGGR